MASNTQSSHVLISFWIFANLLHLVVCRVDKYCTLADSKNNVGLCGHEFADLLSMLCKPAGGYNKRSKKSEEPVDGLENEVGSSSFDAFLLPKSAALAYVHNDLKRSTAWHTVNGKLMFSGAMCECCHNRCDFSELVNYCVDPKAAMAAMQL